MPVLYLVHCSSAIWLSASWGNAVILNILHSITTQYQSPVLINIVCSWFGGPGRKLHLRNSDIYSLGVNRPSLISNINVLWLARINLGNHVYFNFFHHPCSIKKGHFYFSSSTHLGDFFIIFIIFLWCLKGCITSSSIILYHWVSSCKKKFEQISSKNSQNDYSKCSVLITSGNLRTRFFWCTKNLKEKTLYSR